MFFTSSGLLCLDLFFLIFPQLADFSVCTSGHKSTTYGYNCYRNNVNYNLVMTIMILGDKRVFTRALSICLIYSVILIKCINQNKKHRRIDVTSAQVIFTDIYHYFIVLYRVRYSDFQGKYFKNWNNRSTKNNYTLNIYMQFILKLLTVRSSITVTIFKWKKKNMTHVFQTLSQDNSWWTCTGWQLLLAYH